MNESKTLFNPPNKGTRCHCPTVLETRSGSLLVAWYAYPEEEHVGASLALARREKNQWETSQCVIDTGAYSLGNPVLFQEPGEERIWLLYVVLKGNYWNDAILEGIWSHDDGKTWTQPVQLWKEKGLMVRHPPVEVENGSLLLPAYDEKTKRSVLLSSRPPCERWEEVYRFADLDLIQPVLIRENKGRLSLFFRPCSDPRQIWRSHSSGSGTSWTTPMRTHLPNPLSGIGAFTVGNDIAVVYNHTEEHQRHPLSISVSRDSGTTWDTPWHIDTSEQEVSYPSFINGTNGIIHGVYTHNRRTIKYVSLSKNQFM